jgi:transcriptional regulator with GAF, ATPase, and Fis domain
MSEIARSLQEEHADLAATLQTITAGAVDAVPGVESASISYVTGHRTVESRAATGELARRADELQTRVHEGPCLDSIWTQQTVRIDDMATEHRWPRFAAGAAALGAGSSLSFRLFVEEDDLGALNLYATEPHTFGAESEDVGLVFAAHAAVALAGARHEHDLQAALGSRDVIGQAKGILMERYKLPADEAFLLLARVSQRTNRKLVEIARDLTETGALP